ASICVMDYNGHVVGVVGGRGEKKGNRTLNRATQSPRQPGSAIKPLSAYAPAIEYNMLTYGSKVLDQPINTTIDGKSGRWPVNYSGYYSGRVSATWALEESLNTIPVRLIKEMGERRSFDFLTKKLGIHNYVESVDVNGSKKSDINLSSLAVGGSVYGVTSRELTAAYATFGNLGYYWKPTTYTKVLDQKNEIVLKQQERPVSAMSEDTANIMNEMLQRVTKNGTGSPAKFGNWPIISKTGTTTDTKDRWFVGGTPYYVASVWFGYDTNEKMNIRGTNPALRVWNAAMQPIHKSLELKDFPESSTCKYMKYCNSSGMVATSGCSSVSYGWFKGGYQPTCNIHSGVKLDPITKPKPVGNTKPVKDEGNSSGNNSGGNSNNDNKTNGDNKKTTTNKSTEVTVTTKSQEKTTSKPTQEITTEITLPPPTKPIRTD
ncbi:MAG: penicillin-binding transpeptidase domain-containing protein, partial [Eubacterium sp.]